MTYTTTQGRSPAEIGRWAAELGIDELRLVRAVVEGELDRREGRQKYVLPGRSSGKHTDKLRRGETLRIR